MGSNKKALKRNPALKNLLDEVSRGTPSKGRETVFAKGKLTEPSMGSPQPAPKRVRKLNASTKASLVSLIKEREKAKSRLEQLKVAKIETEADRDRVENRITDIVEKYGTPLQGKDAKDRVLFVDPYKAHLVWTERAGTVDTEAVAAEYPELLDPGTEIVNLSMLMQVLSTYEVPEGSKAFAEKFRKFIEQLERSTGQTLLERNDDRLLNLEKYEEYKRIGKISDREISKFESESGSHALRINKLSDGPRCSTCGFDLPKRKTKSHKVTCRRCGHTN